MRDELIGLLDDTGRDAREHPQDDLLEGLALDAERAHSLSKVARAGDQAGDRGEPFEHRASRTDLQRVGEVADLFWRRVPAKERLQRVDDLVGEHGACACRELEGAEVKRSWATW